MFHLCECKLIFLDNNNNAMVCKKVPRRIARYQVLNDIIWQSFGSASISATKELSGLVRQDGKQPDGLILIPWQGGKVGCHCCQHADTVVCWRAVTGVGMVAELATEQKLTKCSNLPTNLIFQPIAVENFRTFSSSPSDFISAFGHKISSVSGEVREASFLFQHVSVSVQRFSSVLFHDCFAPSDSFED